MPGDRSATSDRGHRVGMSILLLAIIGVSAILIVNAFWRAGRPGVAVPSRSPAGTPSSTSAGTGRITGYVGAAACRECHPGESALSARSGHGHTLWPARAGRNPVVAWLDGKTWKDPEVPEITWSYHVKEGQLLTERAVDSRIESFLLDYGFGSGKHGVTFVALRPGNVPGLGPAGVEHRVSYIAHNRSIGITPGHERSKRERLEPRDVPLGKPMGREPIQQCFQCHSTLTSTLGGNQLEAATLIPNVSCERCHGPGRSHIEAARRGQDGLTLRMGSDRREPWVEVDQCGECHRVPRSVSSSSIRPDNPGIVRFQGVGVSMSACYAKGSSGFCCTTCHDPHDRTSSDHARYEAACLSCHPSATSRKACPISPAANCIGCHMPRREIPGNGVFTDHWIRKPAPTRPSPPKSEPS